MIQKEICNCSQYNQQYNTRNNQLKWSLSTIHFFFLQLHIYRGIVPTKSPPEDKPEDMAEPFWNVVISTYKNQEESSKMYRSVKKKKKIPQCWMFLFLFLSFN